MTTEGNPDLSARRTSSSPESSPAHDICREHHPPSIDPVDHHAPPSVDDGDRQEDTISIHSTAVAEPSDLSTAQRLATLLNQSPAARSSWPMTAGGNSIRAKEGD
jgi:hypothetical protein